MLKETPTHGDRIIRSVVAVTTRTGVTVKVVPDRFSGRQGEKAVDVHSLQKKKKKKMSSNSEKWHCAF